MKKKAAIGRAVQEELAAMETQSNMSRDSSLPPHPMGISRSDLLATLGGETSSNTNAQHIFMQQTEQNARNVLTQPPAVNLINRPYPPLFAKSMLINIKDTVSHMNMSLIDSEDEDSEPQAHMLLGT
jgi:hypothetical protein